jgi:hypothetical protein
MNFPKEELRKPPGYHAFFKIHPDTKGKKRKESRLLLSPEQLITVSLIQRNKTGNSEASSRL